MCSTIQKGKVILAGAGPGDPELITVKLQRRIAEADVIIADRLVNPDIISAYAAPHAEVIAAGKKGYHEASVAQEMINQLIVAHALAGKTVLRLKGGDIAFFSNVLDELASLTEENIPYEIIPGITAASGASATTGIPLTARGYAQGVQFLSFNPNSYYSTDKWKALAHSNDTLVFYMAGQNLAGLTELLLRYSGKPDTPMAIIEQATTIYQQVHITTLQQYTTAYAGYALSSPVLVIIGAVVNLYERFHWFDTSAKGTIFNQLVS
jgi:uroporphyrin-III C-methyltransferase